jgi:hypothetical protein
MLEFIVLGRIPGTDLYMSYQLALSLSLLLMLIMEREYKKFLQSKKANQKTISEQTI